MKPIYAKIAKEHSGELKLKFLQFLKEHDAFDNYKKNIMKFINKSRFGDVMNVLSCQRIIDLLYNGNGEVNYYEYFIQLINYAFCWRDTQQGHYYWEDLNILWRGEVLNFIRNKAHTK
jgi:hypothetical protein